MSVYRGRFAPTPSGPLHFGSLIAALASYLDARHQQGHWLLRIEDIDPPRCPAGAADTILRQLEAFGLHWDGPVHWQHDRDGAYQAALARLEAQGLAYPCSCSRKQWRDHPIYPGWCRTGPREPDKPLAWRLRSDLGPRPIVWQDRLFGLQRFDPAALGDVVLKRKDDLWAYQLAVVVDDGAQGITDVVRGFDLLDNTPWQRQLQHALALPEPRYLHLPLILADNGQKLSKQNLAPALPEQAEAARPLLHRALVALDQAPPAALATEPASAQLDWAIAHWSPQRLQATAEKREPHAAQR
ncbi:tRNA glutamyl-Q(34) synthetase GluQRS [Halomonas elongata]|uniref:Glutamyl-Q tRNA(Asp) synthetase n=1 Tax=Halomonas elongata (strain ATCC 33173 / DSM 2581 / NBRC 15536 / NCIMB 2198 / 1H9) TaxID=768066 RepID=E1VAQ7_HALED|nr:tRNA glutamyl-Q(34) synthetase GluQRS [Halomonas elongata]WBF17758.1 tRNA glutamyl-Q(34) synthetase GluQRS [Halomonas elongata]WPU46603.1 tRNA glutamyl-Q(34) synthetase GluQRS [Halomonas elongata DSM 2581]CBV44006.1 glutamyl-Q tRNA(Asp) synthetase [Halomonas elongata DSM 2581]